MWFEMHLKMGCFGKYMACTNEECKNTRKILRNGEVAPPKEDPVPLPILPRNQMLISCCVTVLPVCSWLPTLSEIA